MTTRFLFACLAIALGFAATTQLFAAEPHMEAAGDAAAYVESIQNADGGFPGFGPSSSAGSTIDAVFALSATGIDAKTIENGSNGPDDYLGGQAASFSASSPGSAAKLVLGVLAMNLDETSFGSIDPYAAMEANYNSGTGQYGTDTFAQTLFILAVDSAGQPVPPAAVTYLGSLQLSDGSWEFCCGFGGDTNTTALALRALLASGVLASDPAIVDGLGFLAANQEADGGFPYLLTFGSEPNSTGFVLQALVAAGENIDADGPWDKGAGLTPQAWLVDNQNPSTGALRYFGTDDAFATYQGLPGLTLAPYPERADVDGDGLVFAADNCPTASNPAQLNTDGNLIDNPPPYVVDDVTNVVSDKYGDPCDLDNDNDGRSDSDEAAGTGCTGTSTNPALADSDGDRFLDGPECVLGSSPANPASKPTLAACGAAGDADGDRLSNRIEVCFYNSNPMSIDSDGDRTIDGGADGCEAASLNVDRVVSSIDQGILAQGIVHIAPYTVNVDINKDGTLSSIDQGLMASFIVPSGQCP